MTIIAGFRCAGGVVLCADTQETMTVGSVPLSKKNVPKLRFEELDPVSRVLGGRPDIALAVCGAGYGPFIDKLADEIWKAVKDATAFPEACESAEKKIKDVYAEYGQIYQQGSCPEVELIYGIRIEGASRLFHASGPVVNEKGGYSAAGVGSYMADYLASSMYQDDLSVRQCVVLAAYVLLQAKEHVDGCGGDTHIVVLRDKESCGRIDARRVEIISDLLGTLQSRPLGSILLHSADLGLMGEDFVKKAAELTELMNVNRLNAAKRVKDWDDFWAKMFPTFDRDDLGLYVPPKPTR